VLSSRPVRSDAVISHTGGIDIDLVVLVFMLLTRRDYTAKTVAAVVVKYSELISNNAQFIEIAHQTCMKKLNDNVHNRIYQQLNNAN